MHGVPGWQPGVIGFGAYHWATAADLSLSRAGRWVSPRENTCGSLRARRIEAEAFEWGFHHLTASADTARVPQRLVLLCTSRMFMVDST